ncbi:MAG: hypothetical protein ABUL72_05830 [Armatimonadota bacterium]
MRAFLCLVILLALTLVGCGGSTSTVASGGGGSVPGGKAVKPQVVVAWPARSRDFTGPSAAESVSIVFALPGTMVTQESYAADRPAALTASSPTYTAPLTLPSGAYVLSLTFHSQAGGAGNVVGIATASVQVADDGTVKKADGSDLGAIATTGTIASLAVTVPNSIPAGTPTTILVQATDSKGGTFALSPGAVTYQFLQGASLASFSADGKITGSGGGVSSFSAHSDGVTSPPVSVIFSQVLSSPISLNLQVNHMVYDPASGHIWASVPGSVGAPYGNTVVEINPATGTIIGSIPVGSDPNALAISDDSKRLYVGLDGALSICPVDLNARTALPAFTLAPNTFGGSQTVADLAVQPGNNKVVAAVQADIGDSGIGGPFIYDDGAHRGQTGKLYEGTRLVWPNSSTIFAVNVGFSPQNTFKDTIDATGITKTETFENILLGHHITLIGNKIVSSAGDVVDSASGAKLGKLGGAASGITVAGLANTKEAVVMFDSGGGTVSLTLFDLETYLPKSAFTSTLPFPDYMGEELTRFGSSGFAYHVGGTVYFVGGLPGA